jgi:hypothetical protein
LGHILLFWKVTMQAFQKTPNFQWIFPLKKNFGEGSLCTRGAAGIWAMHIFSSTYFGEISIFGLSKDPATRNWSTLMNPEQFLILVLYLLLCFRSLSLFETLHSMNNLAVMNSCESIVWNFGLNLTFGPRFFHLDFIAKGTP